MKNVKLLLGLLLVGAAGNMFAAESQDDVTKQEEECLRQFKDRLLIQQEEERLRKSRDLLLMGEPHRTNILFNWHSEGRFHPGTPEHNIWLDLKCENPGCSGIKIFKPGSYSEIHCPKCSPVKEKKAPVHLAPEESRELFSKVYTLPDRREKDFCARPCQNHCGKIIRRYEDLVDDSFCSRKCSSEYLRK